MKDCLTYYRNDKVIKMKYLQLDSMTIETPHQSKENYVFFMVADGTKYTLKANSRIDYEGWVYAIKNRSL
jgi:hypothetical protein